MGAQGVEPCWLESRRFTDALSNRTDNAPAVLKQPMGLEPTTSCMASKRSTIELWLHLHTSLLTSPSPRLHFRLRCSRRDLNPQPRIASAALPFELRPHQPVLRSSLRDSNPRQSEGHSDASPLGQGCIFISTIYLFTTLPTEALTRI